MPSKTGIWHFEEQILHIQRDKGQQGELTGTFYLSTGKTSLWCHFVMFFGAIDSTEWWHCPLFSRWHWLPLLYILYLPLGVQGRVPRSAAGFAIARPLMALTLLDWLSHGNHGTPFPLWVPKGFFWWFQRSSLSHPSLIGISWKVGESTKWETLKSVYTVAVALFSIFWLLYGLLTSLIISMGNWGDRELNMSSNHLALRLQVLLPLLPYFDYFWMRKVRVIIDSHLPGSPIEDPYWVTLLFRTCHQRAALRLFNTSHIAVRNRWASPAQRGLSPQAIAVSVRERHFHTGNPACPCCLTRCDAAGLYWNYYQLGWLRTPLQGACLHWKKICFRKIRVGCTLSSTRWPASR
jgi:hypothetical protein